MTEQQPPQGDFPPVHPSGTEDTAFTPPDFLNNLPNFIAQFLENFVGTVVKAIIGVFIPGDFGAAFSQLENWATSLLPAQILQPIHDLVAALISLLGYIPIVGPIITQLADIFGFLNDNTTTAQDSADTANAAILELTGGLIVDSFNRDAAADLGANWNQYNDTGAGARGTSGAGTAVWAVSGAFPNTCINQHVISLVTDIQVAKFYLTTALTSTAVQDPAISLMLRCNAAADTYVEGRVYFGGCEIGYTVSGTYHRLGAAVAIDSNDGDLWEFRAGTGTSGDDPYTFQLLQNGVTVMPRIDTGHASQLGASYRQAGWIDYAGQNAFFFVFAQEAPPEVAVLTADDRTP